MLATGRNNPARKETTMPRIPTPKGYYTSTEATKALGISPAMLRIHVQKGRVKYLVPPGRKQGFYLKKDVDNLAREMFAFLDIEVKEEIKFLTASKDDLPEIEKINTMLFGNDTDNNEVPDLKYKLVEKNPETQFVLKKDNKIIGVATILPFKANSNKIKEIFSAETVRDSSTTIDDIETFHAGNHVDIFIVNIGIRPDLSVERKLRKYYGARLINNLTDKVIELGSRGVIIEKIMAAGDSHMGIRILQSAGFHEIPPIPPTKRAFTIEMQESGSHMGMQYKQALEGSGILDSKVPVS